MKKKLLVSLFINIAYSSDTIFKLIEPYKISNNTHINTLLILSGGICVDKIRSTILNKLSPSNETNQATEKKNFKIAKITLITSLQILFSPIVVFPLLLNVIHKKQVVGWDMLAKYFCIELGSGILIKSTHHFVSQNIGFIKDPLKNRFENNQLKKEHSTALKCYNKDIIKKQGTKEQKELKENNEDNEKREKAIDDTLLIAICLLLEFILKRIHFNIFDYQLIKATEYGPIYSKYFFNSQNKFLNWIIKMDSRVID